MLPLSSVDSNEETRGDCRRGLGGSSECSAGGWGTGRSDPQAFSMASCVEDKRDRDEDRGLQIRIPFTAAAAPSSSWLSCCSWGPLSGGIEGPPTGASFSSISTGIAAWEAAPVPLLLLLLLSGGGPLRLASFFKRAPALEGSFFRSVPSLAAGLLLLLLLLPLPASTHSPTYTREGRRGQRGSGQRDWNLSCSRAAEKRQQQDERGDR